MTFLLGVSSLSRSLSGSRSRSVSLFRSRSHRGLPLLLGGLADRSRSFSRGAILLLSECGSRSLSGKSYILLPRAGECLRCGGERDFDSERSVDVRIIAGVEDDGNASLAESPPLTISCASLISGWVKPRSLVAMASTWNLWRSANCFVGGSMTFQ